jgi:L-ascorbate metabolism protein UlaG (beta-lactamase superfamily)
MGDDVTEKETEAREDTASLLGGFTWYKQSAFRWRSEAFTVYIDPWGLSGDVQPADLILITHAHSDHFSPQDIKRVQGPKTVIVAPRDVAKELTGSVKAVAPGERLEPISRVRIETVPAYNIAEQRLDFHPKRNGWVGYVLELDGRTYYHAGDTDHLPELERLKTQVAFLPIGGHYVMDVSEAAGLAKKMFPRLAVPMHYGFVEGVGKGSDGERFKREAQPVTVEVLTPQEKFANP